MTALTLMTLLEIYLGVPPRSSWGDSIKKLIDGGYLRANVSSLPTVTDKGLQAIAFAVKKADEV